MDKLNFLFIGDVIGSSGVRAVFSMLPQLKKKYQSKIVIVNAENANEGFGVTEKICESLFQAGVDIITTGNHAFHNIDQLNYYIKNIKKVLIPGNYPNSELPYFFTLEGFEKKINVINLQGRTNMKTIDCPFTKIDSFLKQHKQDVNILDFHAESTFEKEAMAFFTNGKAAAVIGTHTHIQTADERILSKGTAYITDCGAVRVKRSIIGYDYENSLNTFSGRIPKRHIVKTGTSTIHGVSFQVDLATQKAVFIQRVKEDAFIS